MIYAGMEKDTIITLEDGKRYVLADGMYYQGDDYYLAMGVDEKDNIIPDDIALLKEDFLERELEGESYVSCVEDAALTARLVRIFRAREDFEFRNVRPDEAEKTNAIEQACFPPNEACPENCMYDRTRYASDMFLVAVDKKTGEIAGFLNGIATNESTFRDEFFLDISLYDPKGTNVMLCGLDVLPEYRRRGLASAIVAAYIERERANGRTSLILTCLDFRIPMYQEMGFEDKGISGSSWGGEEWHDMVYYL